MVKSSLRTVFLYVVSQYEVVSVNPWWRDSFLEIGSQTVMVLRALPLVLACAANGQRSHRIRCTVACNP